MARAAALSFTAASAQPASCQGNWPLPFTCSGSATNTTAFDFMYIIPQWPTGLPVNLTSGIQDAVPMHTCGHCSNVEAGNGNTGNATVQLLIDNLPVYHASLTYNNVTQTLNFPIPFPQTNAQHTMQWHLTSPDASTPIAQASYTMLCKTGQPAGNDFCSNNEVCVVPISGTPFFVTGGCSCDASVCGSQFPCCPSGIQPRNATQCGVNCWNCNFSC